MGLFLSWRQRLVQRPHLTNALGRPLSSPPPSDEGVIMRVSTLSQQQEVMAQHGLQHAARPARMPGIGKIPVHCCPEALGGIGFRQRQIGHHEQVERHGRDFQRRNRNQRPAGQGQGDLEGIERQMRERR